MNDQPHATSAPGHGAAQVTVHLPSTLADVAGGQRHLTVTPRELTVGGVLDALAVDHPPVVRRIRDETGALRRFVNVYVDAEDVRHLDGTDTRVAPGAIVLVIPSVAGG